MYVKGKMFKKPKTLSSNITSENETYAFTFVTCPRSQKKSTAVLKNQTQVFRSEPDALATKPAFPASGLTRTNTLSQPILWYEKQSQNMTVEQMQNSMKISTFYTIKESL